MVVEVSFKLGPICSSVRPSVLLQGKISEIAHQFFSDFFMKLESCKISQSPIFGKSLDGLGGSKKVPKMA